jgi:hypothetical protein
MLLLLLLLLLLSCTSQDLPVTGRHFVLAVPTCRHCL